MVIIGSEDNEGVLPYDVCPGLLVWDDNGESLYGIATNTQPRRLGLIYCTNRKSSVFKLCVKGGKYFDLAAQRGSGEISCRLPRVVTFSNDKRYLIWLERDLSLPNYPGPHQACFRLMKMNMIGKNKPEIVIDIKEKYDPKIDTFAGLFVPKIGKRCVVAEDTIIITTVVNDTIVPLVCNIATGDYHVFDDCGLNIAVHDCIYSPLSDTAVFAGGRSMPLDPPQIVIGKIGIHTKGDVHKFILSCAVVGDKLPIGKKLPHNEETYVWKTLHHRPESIIKGKRNNQQICIIVTRD